MMVTSLCACLDKGYPVHFVLGDLAEESFRHPPADEALKRRARIDFLVNNAFSFLAKGVTATSPPCRRSFAACG